MQIHETWRWDWALAGWEYRPMVRSDERLIRLHLEAPETRHHWLRALLDKLPALLGDFGYPTKAEVSTLTEGEFSHVVDWRSQGGLSALLAFVEQKKDIFDVLVSLDLTCVDKSLAPMEIKTGAALWIKILLTESGELNVAWEDPVHMRVILNTDIYAPISFGRVRDNALLAALNSPRLAGFLERFERDVPAQLIELDEENYRGMLGPRGFKAAPSTLSDA